MRKMFFGALVTAGVFLVVGLPKAASADSFYTNKIMDDAVFDYSGSMSASQIDAFLNTFPSSCISSNSGFKAIDPNGYNPTNGFLYGGYVTAGQVIYDAAQAYGINPQVLITTLEKEQSLITGQNNYSGYCNNGDQHKYAAAAGYGCPDSGTTYSYTGLNLYQRNGVTVTSTGTTCVNSALKAGFSQQVIRAAWLLKFGEQRSKGNINWAVISGNWNNSDDPQTCYSGPMTQGTFARCPSGGASYYDGYTTIDGTAVHMDDGATAALYWYTPHFSGNQSFFNIYTSWFGTTFTPFAFKSSTDSTIYMYAGGYRFIVPAMAILQDYGISPQSIQTVSQSYIDSIPLGDATQNISTALSSIVKSPSDSDGDGGSIYLISVGKRYQVTSMTQFADFGFNESNIAYLPLSYILSLPSGGSLSNYVTSPYGSVFQVAAGYKHIIFEYSTYIKNNPSDHVTHLSYYLADNIPSSTPLTDSPVLIKYSTGDSLLLYAQGSYSSVWTYDEYQCWGFDSVLHTPVYRLPQNNYIAPVTSPTPIGCTATENGTPYILSGGTRLPVPASVTISPPAVPSYLSSLFDTLPLRSTPLSQYVKLSNSSGVWYIGSDKRRLIPTYNSFVMLGLSASQLDTIPSIVLSSFSDDGILLAPGQLVKDPSSAAVYVTGSTGRYAFATSDLFLAYKNSWGSIDTIDTASLNRNYPADGSISPMLINKQSGKAYLISSSGCFSLSGDDLTAFGTSSSSLISTQPYDSSIFRNINFQACQNATRFIKIPGQSLVYWVDGGQKHPILTYAALLNKNGGSEPLVITLDPTYVATIPTGNSLQ